MVPERPKAPSRRAKVKHRSFNRWISRVSPQTAKLARLVEEYIQPFAENLGFERVDFLCGLPKDTIAPYELVFEKVEFDMVKSICFQFEKWGTARFQVRANIFRLPQTEDRDIVCLRGAALVQNKWQYVHFWGKPMLSFNMFWPERRYVKTVKLVLSRMPQLVAFLESGVRPKNVSNDPLAK